MFLFKNVDCTEVPGEECVEPGFAYQAIALGIECLLLLACVAACFRWGGERRQAAQVRQPLLPRVNS